MKKKKQEPEACIPNRPKTHLVRIQHDTFVRLSHAKGTIHQWANSQACKDAFCPIMIEEPSYDQVIATLLSLWEMSVNAKGEPK